MRIDSLTYLNTSLLGIQGNQTAIARLNQQIATGMSLLAGKDDPVAATKAMDLKRNSARYVERVAWVLYSVKRYAEAKKAYEKLLE